MADTDVSSTTLIQNVHAFAQAAGSTDRVLADSIASTNQLAVAAGTAASQAHQLAQQAKQTADEVTSATLTVSKSGKTVTLTATDKNGTTTETVSDGEDGRPGADGAPGPSPAHKWVGTNLQFQNPDGSWGDAVDLKGEQGRDGQTPPLTSDLTSTAPDVALSALGGKLLKDAADAAQTAANSNRRNVGELVHSLVPLDDAGLHLLDGTLLAADGMYAAGIAKIAALQADHPGLFVTEADWQASVAAYGACGKFVYDATAGTLRLPKVTGFLEASIDAAALGDLVEAGLPNITGGFNKTAFSTGGFDLASLSGAFSSGSGVNRSTMAADAMKPSQIISFDASRSNPIYGNSATVQPQSIKGFVYMVLANTVKAPVVVDAEQYANDVNALAGDVATRTTAAGAAHAAMPSGHLITVSMPFTAPSDGWIHVAWGSTTGRVGLFILAPENTQNSTAFSLTAGSAVDITLPISAGQTATATGSFANAVFTYANGTAPTA